MPILTTARLYGKAARADDGRPGDATMIVCSSATDARAQMARYSGMGYRVRKFRREIRAGGYVASVHVLAVTNHGGNDVS